MPDYIVFRHGSNGANQPMTPRLAIGMIAARNRKLATQQAIASYEGQCYANQHLELVPVSRASRDDLREAEEMSMARSLEEAANVP